MSQAALAQQKTYFEEFVAWVPDEFKGLARTVTDKLAWPLEQVAGDPDALRQAAAEFSLMGEGVRQVATDHSACVAAVGTSWSGEAHTAFATEMGKVGGALEDLAHGFDKLRDLLIEAADVSAAAFNLILDIIAQFMLWLVREVILAGVARLGGGVVGAALGVVNALKKLAETLSKISAEIQRVVQALQRLCERLQEIQRLLERYREKVTELGKLRFKKSSRPDDYWKEHWQWVVPSTVALNLASPVPIPGPVDMTLDAGLGYQDITDGSKDRNYVFDTAYDDLVAPFKKSIQDVVDAAEQE